MSRFVPFARSTSMSKAMSWKYEEIRKIRRKNVRLFRWERSGLRSHCPMDIRFTTERCCMCLRVNEEICSCSVELTLVVLSELRNLTAPQYERKTEQL